MKQFWLRLNKKERRLLVVAVIILLYGIIDISMNFKKYKEALSTPPADGLESVADTLNPEPNTPANDITDLLIQQRRWVKDPFYPRRGNKVKAPVNVVTVRTTELPVTLTLQAISISRTEKAALINGTVVSEGDRIAAWTVLAIAEKSVVLQNAYGKKVRLTIP